MKQSGPFKHRRFPKDITANVARCLTYYPALSRNLPAFRSFRRLVLHWKPRQRDRPNPA